MIFAIIILMTIFCGCTTDKLNHDIYSKIYERYSDIKSYTAVIDVTVYSNVKEGKYTFRQYYRAPDNYRLDVLKPENIAGSGCLFYEDGLYMYSNGIGEKFDGYIPSDKNYMFLTDFFENYYKGEETAAAVAKNLSGEQTVLTSAAVSDNEYRFCQKLWIDNKTCLPSRLDTFDINNKPVITVTFTEFELNPKISDDVFKR